MRFYTFKKYVRRIVQKSIDKFNLTLINSTRLQRVDLSFYESNAIVRDMSKSITSG